MCTDNGVSESNRPDRIRIRGAIFDLDGTILDSMSMWRTLLEDALLRKGISPEPFMSLNVWAKNEEFKEAYLSERYGFSSGLKELSAEFPDRISSFYKEKAMPKPGAVEFLSYLKRSGVKIALATATPLKYMESALDRLDIKRYFDVILTTRDVGKGKSSPDVYDVSRERLGVDKDEAVIFEDANYAINTAKKNGYRVIAIDDYWQFRKRQENMSLADRFIYDWSEVYAFIEPVQ